MIKELENSNKINTIKGNSESGRRIYTAAVINLGCKVNRYEADSMRKIMADSGIELVEPEDIADFYIVNTCSVTNIAERKSRQMLRRAKRRNPEAIVIAAGCYVNAAHDELLALDFVDAVIGNDRKCNIMEVLEKYMIRDTMTDGTTNTQDNESNANEDMVDGHPFAYNSENIDHKPDIYVKIDKSADFEEMGELTSSYLDHQRAYIKVQDGCNQFCSYCIIPYTRGRIRSRAPEKVVAEISGLARSGVKEFVLTGIHISSYGRDFSDIENNINYNNVRDLGDLICCVAKIPEVKRIRLGSLEPRIITKEFLDKISTIDKLCPHFHLSLQSACNETLKRMNRKYTIEEYTESCRMIREYFDRPAITTDVIVGFPGETEEEFGITLDNLKRLNLYEIHVFKYSVRQGTVAEKMPDQVPENIKNERSDILLELTSGQKKDYETSLKGITDEVLVEEMLNADNDKCKMFTGYTKRYVKVQVENENEIVGEIIPYTF